MFVQNDEDKSSFSSVHVIGLHFIINLGKHLSQLWKEINHCYLSIKLFVLE